MYIYIYVYVYIYIYIYMYTNTITWIGIDPQGSLQSTCLVATGSADRSIRVWDLRAKKAQVFTVRHSHRNVYVDVFIPVYVLMYTCMYMYLFIYVYIWSIWIYIDANICIYIHILICILISYIGLCISRAHGHCTYASLGWVWRWGGGQRRENTRQCGQRQNHQAVGYEGREVRIGHVYVMYIYIHTQTWSMYNC
jgi:hypothetical protein